MTRTVVLVGLPGVGKTSVGRVLARELGYPFVDTDEHVEERAGMSVDQIWRQVGEPAFRALEATTIRTLTRPTGASGLVIAAAGGAVILPDNRWHLYRHAEVFWLQASIDSITARLHAAAYKRPHIDYGTLPSELGRLLEARAAFYRPAHRIDASRPFREVVDAVRDHVGRTRSPDCLYDRERGSYQMVVATQLSGPLVDRLRSTNLRRGQPMVTNDLPALAASVVASGQGSRSWIVTTKGMPCLRPDSLPSTLAWGARVALATRDQNLADALVTSPFFSGKRIRDRGMQASILAERWVEALALSSAAQLGAVATPWLVPGYEAAFQDRTESIAVDTIASMLISVVMGAMGSWTPLATVVVQRYREANRFGLIPGGFGQLQARSDECLIPTDQGAEGFIRVPVSTCARILEDTLQTG